MSWQGASLVPPKTWVCGFCGNNVTSVAGLATDDGEEGVRICPGCAAATYFDRRGDVHPKAAPGDRIDHLPNVVHDLHDEARRTIQARAYTATVMLCRAMISQVAVHLGADAGESFQGHVTWLHNDHHIPPAATGWVRYILEVSNESDHAVRIKDESEALLVLKFTDALLRNVYELPASLPPPERRK